MEPSQIIDLVDAARSRGRGEGRTAAYELVGQLLDALAAGIKVSFSAPPEDHPMVRAVIEKWGRSARAFHERELARVDAEIAQELEDAKGGGSKPEP